jgi:hypothetical protein
MVTPCAADHCSNQVLAAVTRFRSVMFVVVPIRAFWVMSCLWLHKPPSMPKTCTDPGSAPESRKEHPCHHVNIQKTRMMPVAHLPDNCSLGLSQALLLRGRPPPCQRTKHCTCPLLQCATLSHTAQLISTARPAHDWAGLRCTGGSSIS